MWLIQHLSRKYLRRASCIIPAVLLALAATTATAQVNPLTIISKAVTTHMDVRTKDEVANDTTIEASANKRLLDDKRAEWSGVTLLVFSQHVVLAGAVKSDEAKKLVAEVVSRDPKIRSLTNDLIVIRKPGDKGSLVKDAAFDAKINAALTGAKGIHSVNMRWKSVNGQVVLMGAAQSKEEADLAASTLKGLNGMKSLKSELRIVPPKK